MAGITLSELLKKMIEMAGSDLFLSDQQRAAGARAREAASLGYAAVNGGGHQGAGL